MHLANCKLQVTSRHACLSHAAANKRRTRCRFNAVYSVKIPGEINQPEMK